MTIRGGLPEIPSNFDITQWVDTNPGINDWCQTVEKQGGLRFSEGKLRFLCEVRPHLNYDDCIVYPGQPGASHLHQYYGNTLTNAFSTYESLRRTGDSTCQGGPLIRTAYWLPAMIKPASPGFPVPKVVIPAHAQLYYQADWQALADFVSPNKDYPHTNFGTRPFPNGLQIVTGWEHRHPMPPPFKVWGWDHQAYRPAADGSSHGTLQEMYDAADPATRNDPPRPGADGYPFTGLVIARLSTPGFWDGVNLRDNPVAHPHASGLGPGRSHLSWGLQDGYGNLIGPPTHPYRIPHVTLIINYDNNGANDWKDWYLSVDRHNGHNLGGGHGFHADWFGAMDPTIQTINEEEHMALHTRDPNGVKTSSSGVLCRNDWNLTFRGLRQDLIHLPEAERYADIPNPPGRKRVLLNLTAA